MQRGSKLKEYVEERGEGCVYTPGPRVFGPPPGTIIFLWVTWHFSRKKCQKMKKNLFAMACIGMSCPTCTIPWRHGSFLIFQNCYPVRSMCSRATTEHICKSSNLILCVCAICFCNGEFVEKACQSWHLSVSNRYPYHVKFPAVFEKNRKNSKNLNIWGKIK